jgi:hypothetical protein
LNGGAQEAQALGIDELIERRDDMRIPTQSGRLFRFEAGHGTDLIPATIPK